MTEDDNLQDPKYWRDRAADARAKAENMSAPEIKERMLQIAAEYDRLAQFALRRREAEARFIRGVPKREETERD